MKLSKLPKKELERLILMLVGRIVASTYENTENYRKEKDPEVQKIAFIIMVSYALMVHDYIDYLQGVTPKENFDAIKGMITKIMEEGIRQGIIKERKESNDAEIKNS